MKDQQKVVKPMDDGIRERAIGAPSTNSRRVCWAIKTLVAEVTDLFPETTVEYSNYDGRNTALDATFDLSMLEDEDTRLLTGLLSVLPGVDSRVRDVDWDDSAAHVSMRPSLRTQDIRDPFGLADAFMVLTEDDETGGSL